ncbi:MAG: PEP-CTERM sorting domain-containing protein [Phycisphaerales bacterium]|nr:PEP-CTERM sorting domain-containing protein [Phycisphaerales bacterium]
MSKYPQQLLLALGLIGAATLPASAAIYNDSLGDNFDGNAHMDIASVEVTNDATNITVKVTLNGPIGSPNDWGKYMMGIDSAAGGDSAGNGWARPISMPGMDYWIGSWVDSGGRVQLFLYNGSSWVGQAAPTQSIGTNSVTWTVPQASLGLTIGNSFNFDVYTAGGGSGDSANDASSNPSQSTTGWGGPYNSNALVSSYTLTPVPEPAVLGLFSLAGLSLVRRRNRA